MQSVEYARDTPADETNQNSRVVHPANQTTSSTPDIPVPYPHAPLARLDIQVLPDPLSIDEDCISETERASVDVAGFLPTLYPKDMFAVHPNTVVNAMATNLYDIEARRWREYPPSQPSEQENATAAFLDELTRSAWRVYAALEKKLPCFARQWVVTRSTRVLLSGESVQVPGIALVYAGLKSVQWADILCDVQIVSSVEQMPEALRRLTCGAANVFASQGDRFFHIGIALAGDSFQVAYFDRAGRVLSGIRDAHRCCVLFTRVLMGLTMLDASYCGKDTSLASRGGQFFVTVGGLEYRIVETLSIGKEICGRGTVCWRCRRSDSDKDYVIKNIWADKRQHPTEGDFLRMASSIDGIANLVCDEPVPWPHDEHRTTVWLRDLVQGPDRADVLSGVPHLELRRLVFDQYGKPLEEFATKDELILALRDAVEAHEQLYDTKDVLHCDISDNNIVLCEVPGSSRRRGLLIDLDSAIVAKPDGEYKRGPIGRTAGTLPFTACAILLSPDTVAHSPWHDMESFLYVLMIICSSYAGPSSTPRNDVDVRSLKIGRWLDGNAGHKARVMFGYDDDQFRGFLDESFHPYFDDLKELVFDLRTAIARTKWATDRVFLDIFDRHIRQRQSSDDHAAPPASQCAAAGPSGKDDDSEEQDAPERSAADLPQDDRTAMPPPPTPREKASSSSSHASDDSEVTLVEPRRSSQATKETCPAITRSSPSPKRKAVEEQTTHSPKRQKVDHVD
ncbi:hypothetical protein BD626DRAFT_409583 [Schizophyllum amplum]|uniref:Fungal-type protein kinase domain-containing protein n=1 Tax=Schizophyllum amplum TaxID=97359 RepID=A0A550C2S9_9AGAR|nr:hypothetical protein BD626DRAFT_409583 [Auriculariopsis ampla]